jgi:hypothetical protein
MALLRAEGDAAPITATTVAGPLTVLPAPLLPRFLLERDGRVRRIVR